MSVQSWRRIAGVMVMLLGVALVGYGAHYLIENGTCPGTGYAAVGPVPACGGGPGGWVGEGLDTMSAFILGPALAVAGWGLARLRGALWLATCIALGVGLVTIRAGQGATPVAKAFGPVAGTCFLAFALASAVTGARTWLRARSSRAARSAAGQRTTVVAVTPSSPGPAPTEELERDKAAPLARI